VHYFEGYVKDLSLLGRPLSDVMIVDNSPFCYILNKENAIPISSWNGNRSDAELIKLIPVLSKLANSKNLVSSIHSIFHQNQMPKEQTSPTLDSFRKKPSLGHMYKNDYILIRPSKTPDIRRTYEIAIPKFNKSKHCFVNLSKQNSVRSQLSTERMPKKFAKLGIQISREVKINLLRSEDECKDDLKKRKQKSGRDGLNMILFGKKSIQNISQDMNVMKQNIELKLKTKMKPHKCKLGNISVRCLKLGNTSYINT
jgi:hypothetical protein